MKRVFCCNQTNANTARSIGWHLFSMRMPNENAWAESVVHIPLVLLFCKSSTCGQAQRWFREKWAIDFFAALVFLGALCSAFVWDCGHLLTFMFPVFHEETPGWGKLKGGTTSKQIASTPLQGEVKQTHLHVHVPSQKQLHNNQLRLNQRHNHRPPSLMIQRMMKESTQETHINLGIPFAMWDQQKKSSFSFHSQAMTFRQTPMVHCESVTHPLSFIMIPTSASLTDCPNGDQSAWCF